jgi:hypothetical protein
MLPTQILKDRLRFDCFVPFQKFHNLWPYLLERIPFRVLHVRCLFVWLGSFFRSRYFRAVFSSHSRFRRCCSQRLLFLDQLHESPVLPICNHPSIVLVGHTLSRSKPPLKSGNFNCRQPGVLIVADQCAVIAELDRFSMVIQKIRQLRMQKTAIKFTSRSAVRSFDSSALHPDFRIL